MVNTIPEAVADIQRLMEAARKATDDGEYKSVRGPSPAFLFLRMAVCSWLPSKV